MPNKEDIFLIWHIGSQLRIVLVTRGIGNLRLMIGKVLKMSILLKFFNKIYMCLKLNVNQIKCFGKMFFPTGHKYWYVKYAETDHLEVS